MVGRKPGSGPEAAPTAQTQTAGANRAPITAVSQIVFLAGLVDRFAGGKIRVPNTHRGLSWNSNARIKLLESVARGFPIGSIVIWSTHQRFATRDRLGPITVGPAPRADVEYLLDGHQRVCTLSAVLLLSEDTPATHGDGDWRMYQNLDTGEIVRHPRRGAEPQHFALKSLLNASAFLHACRTLQTRTGDARTAQRRIEAADRLASTFRNYQIPLIRIEGCEIATATTISERLNTKQSTEEGAEERST